MAQALSVSRSRAVDLLESGAFKLNGVSIKPRRHVKAGDVLEGELPPEVPVTLAGEPGSVPIVFQDAHLLVVDKPAGLTVHPGAGRKGGTLVNILLGMGIPLAPAAGRVRPGVVHRLDRGTSGLMVLVKTDAAYWKLSRMVQGHELKREYLAVVAGVPRPDRGSIEAAVGRDPRHRKRFAVVSAGGRKAVTHYAVERTFKAASLVRVTLGTGRTHQIRVHFAALGWPVLGDQEYGRAAHTSLIGRQALHATRLTFAHPFTRKSMKFESDLPADMQQLVERLAQQAD